MRNSDEAVGPAGEKLNLTRITEPRLDLAAAWSRIAADGPA